MNKEYAQRCADEQKKMCEKNKVPMFAPSDGICFYCGKSIYEYASVEEAGKYYITSCPYCKRSFLD